MINSACSGFLLFISPLRITRSQKHRQVFSARCWFPETSPLTDLSLRQHRAAKAGSCRVSKGVPCKETRLLPALWQSSCLALPELQLDSPSPAHPAGFLWGVYKYTLLLVQLARVRILWAVWVQRAPCVPKPAQEPLPARRFQLPAVALLHSWHSFLCFLYIQNNRIFPTNHWQLPPVVQECGPSPSIQCSAVMCLLRRSAAAKGDVC